MPTPLLLRRAASCGALCASLLLAACGGGGGGADSPTAAATGGLPPSASLAGLCTPAGEKRWLRAWMGETYLWADRLPAADPEAAPTPVAYFDALLLRAPDAQGLPTDRFSMAMPVADADAMQGITAAPSAASLAGGVLQPVPLARTVASPGGRRVGYVLFNDHARGAQDALIDAFAALKAQGVQDLVLDLRYNGGGFLYVARAAAAMAAGTDIAGQVFATLAYNPARSAAGDDRQFTFDTVVQVAEDRYPVGTPLPQLGLPRVYVLTSALTCSASEAIVNALRGVGVEVVLVGGRSCGKPYGFHRRDNCGQAYFPLQFRMANARGESVPTIGLPVQCQVAEDPWAALGSPAEPLLAAALRHADTGACPVVAQSLAAGTPQSGALPSFQRPGAPAPGASRPRADAHGLLP